MQKYLEEILKSGGRNPMNYEWARFESFKTFPATSYGSPMRLAQAGFYYTGTDEEAACFSCAIRNRVWNEGDSAVEIHQLLSPNCAFLTRNDHTNVPIHDSSDAAKSNIDQREPSNGAMGGPNDVRLTTIITTTTTEKIINNNRNNTVAKTTVEKNALTVHRNTQNGITKHEDDRSQIRNTNSFTENIYNCPKYPEYSARAVRFSSFTGWSYTHIVAPKLLAEAGFFYSGFGDCVRCFVCGGGLKNWAFGDNPWVEHAKWYPRCSYILQCKGDTFVTMIAMNDGMYVENTNTTNEQVNAREIEACNNKERCRNDIFEDMASDTVKLALEIGYQHEDVEKGIKLYREKYGSIPLKTQELLECILQDDHASKAHSHTDPSSMQSLNQQTYTHNQPKRAKPQCFSETSNASNMYSKSSEKTKTSLGTNSSPNEDYHLLLEENRALREQATCKICMDKDACIVFLPCGHMIACVECACALRKCAICRKNISRTVKAFPS